MTVIIVGDGKNIPAQLVITGEETVVQKTGARYVLMTEEIFQKIILDFVNSWMGKEEGRERDSTQN